MKLTKTQANLLLLLVAIIWGSGYLFSKLATDAEIAPSMIGVCRGLIYALLAFLFFHRSILTMKKKDFRIGLIAGFINFLSYQIQTLGIKYTTPANSAFLTATYIVFIPFILWLIFHQRPERKSYLAILLCIIGMILLTNILQNGLAIHLGDWLTLLSAALFAIQIVYFSIAIKETNPWVITFMLAVCQVVFGLVWALFFDLHSFGAADWQAGVIPLLFLGVVSSFGAQTMQLIGQKYTDPTLAGIIMMTEAMFGSVFSVLFGFESFSASLVEGGVLIIAAVLLMQLDVRKLFSTRMRAHAHTTKASSSK